MSRAAQTPEEAAPVEVVDLTFIGVEAIDEGRLRAVLRTKERSWLPWKEGRPFDRDALQADLLRIVAYYRDHGFRNARVVSSDIDVDAEIDDTSDLVNEVGLSSLQLMELVELIEDRFDVSFPLNDLADVRTITDLANAIERLTARRR